jgi:integrase
MPKGRQPYVSEWMLHWLHNIARPRVEETTWERSYRQKVEDLIAPYFDGIPLTELAIEHIEAWHATLGRVRSERTGRPLSASTVTTAHRILSSAMNDAVRRKRVQSNPVALISPPQADRERCCPPEDDEVAAILERCETWPSGPRWVTGIATGARQGEILGMLWPYVDLDDASVAIEWELARLTWQHGCEDKPCGKKRGSDCPARHGGGLVLKRPKSEHSRARIPIASYGVDALKKWRTDQKAGRLAHPEWQGWVHTCSRRLKRGQHVCPDCRAPAQPGLLVFTQANGRPIDPRKDWADWKELLESAGVPEYRVHDGRHYVATMLLERGTDERVVQELLRHHSHTFTRQAYQHVRPRLQRDAASVLDQVMRGGRG